jgi:polar amino acid transport system ATP-binding protein
MENSSPAILELKNIHKHFGANHVLKDVDLRVQSGSLVFIIGPSGSGKSTLLRCCNLLETPDSGRVLFKGEDINLKGVDVNLVRQKIGMVFQSFNLYPHMNALSNVSLALRKVLKLSSAESQELSLAALERVGMRHKAESLPSELSGGQQQRVAIARSLALKPDILLFDEPTSALDPELVGGVLKVMRELRESGMTMVVVSHEMSFAKAAADHAVFMDQGKIIEEGTASELFENPSNARVKEFLATLKHD